MLITIPRKQQKMLLGDAYIRYDFVHPHLGGEHYITDGGDKKINYTYQIPGVYFPKLHVGKNVYEGESVIVKSDDWTSYYLALKYGVNPEPVKIIEEFKKKLN